LGGSLKKILILIFCFICFSNLYGTQTLVFAKLKGVSDQFIGEFILEEAYSRLDIDVRFEVFPAERALLYSQQGEVDGEIQRITVIEESSPTLIRVPTPINYVDLSVFFKEPTNFTTLADFSRYTFAYVRGVKIYESLLSYFPKNISVTVDTQMWQMINQGKADLALAGRINGLFTINKLKLDGIYALDPPYQTFPLYHYLNEKHKNLVTKIDKVLRNMAENGELESLRNEAISQLLSSQ
jgi:polar amino acid transport system substrate-binding protein